jgi:sec-independent protein translocase protein TatA
MEWIIVIIVIVLLLFGAKKIPELARSMGKARAEFSRGQAMVEKEIREAERQDREEELHSQRQVDTRPESGGPAGASGDVDPDVRKAAEALGIDPQGKTEEELKVLIKYKMEQG